MSRPRKKTMGKFIDLTGQRFGKWLVLKRDPAKTDRAPKWIVRCECGTIKSVTGYSLRAGFSTNCHTCLSKLDLVGQHFNSWTVLNKIQQKLRGHTFLKCRCVCGTIKSVDIHHLIKGRSKSCGCLNILNLKNRANDLVGKTINRLTVLERLNSDKHNKVRFRCRCSCGAETVVVSSQLKHGKTKSCGCLVDETLRRPHTEAQKRK